jgi:hypothetical protein
MIIVNCDGSLTAEGVPERATQWVNDTIEVPENLVAQQPDLLDRIFTFAFDVMDLQTIDLRIRPVIRGGGDAVRIDRSDDRFARLSPAASPPGA